MIDNRTFYAIDNNEVADIRTLICQVDSLCKLMKFKGVDMDTKVIEQHLNTVRRIVGKDYIEDKKLDF